MADDEDDYMTMTFGEDDGASTKKNRAETSLQRRIRLERQGRERGHVPSKAELAKAAEAEREAALSRSLLDAPTGRVAGSATSKWPAPLPATTQPPRPVNKGLAMMAKMGFVAGEALGRRRESGGDAAEAEGTEAADDRPVVEPIRIQVKRDRAGIGAAEEKKEKAAEGGDAEQDAERDAKRIRLDDLDPGAYRDRLRQEREAARLERQIHAAQVVAERMARGEDDAEDDAKEEVPLRDINVLWRSMVHERRAREHDRAQRIKAQRLLDDALRNGGRGGSDYNATAEHGIGGDDDDEDDDDDDRMAQGRGPGKASFLAGGLKASIAADGEADEQDDDEREKDDELDEFNALPAKERLQQIVDWMRQNRRYCFWCKYTYPDDDLEGCPGPTEEDHD